MRDVERLARPLIVPMPAEIDIANADDVWARLRAACAVGGAMVIADLGSTVFCDCAGVRRLLLAHDVAVAADAELRLVLHTAAVLRVLKVLGDDRVLWIYPSLGAALAARRR